MNCEQVDKDYWDWRSYMGDTWAEQYHIMQRGGPKTPEEMEVIKRWFKQVDHMNELKKKHDECLKQHLVQHHWDNFWKGASRMSEGTKSIQPVIEQAQLCMTGKKWGLIAGIPDIEKAPAWCDDGFWSKENFEYVMKGLHAL